jgi:hypothetical protein
MCSINLPFFWLCMEKLDGKINQGTQEGKFILEEQMREI